MKNKKEPTVLNKDQITESIITSITDHDVGWAGLVGQVTSNGNFTEFFMKSHQWNTADQTFKITVEEVQA
jgi:hypothetical protein